MSGHIFGLLVLDRLFGEHDPTFFMANRSSAVIFLFAIRRGEDASDDTTVLFWFAVSQRKRPQRHHIQRCVTDNVKGKSRRAVVWLILHIPLFLVSSFCINFLLYGLDDKKTVNIFLLRVLTWFVSIEKSHHL